MEQLDNGGQRSRLLYWSSPHESFKKEKKRTTHLKHIGPSWLLWFWWQRASGCSWWANAIWTHQAGKLQRVCCFSWRWFLSFPGFLSPLLAPAFHTGIVGKIQNWLSGFKGLYRDTKENEISKFLFSCWENNVFEPCLLEAAGLVFGRRWVEQVSVKQVITEK